MLLVAVTGAIVPITDSAVEAPTEAMDDAAVTGAIAPATMIDEVATGATDDAAVTAVIPPLT
jgi:hypothetical protein